MNDKRKSGMGRGMLYTALAVAGIGAYAWFNGDPQASRASGLDGHVLYGVSPDSAQLIRYDFISGSLDQVGPVKQSNGNALTGIQASAYFPGFSNIFAFWTDPSDKLTKVVYIRPDTADAVVMGSDLGKEAITGACAVHPDGTTDYDVYAIQASDRIPVTVANGLITPHVDYAVRVAVVGASAQLEDPNNPGTYYDANETMHYQIGSMYYPFGDSSLGFSSNINDGNNPRGHLVPSIVATDTSIYLHPYSWKRISRGPSLLAGTKDSDWEVHMDVMPWSTPNQVLMVRNGDAVPAIMFDYASLPSYIQEYIDPDTKKFVMGTNQILALFEMEVTATTDARTATVATTTDTTKIEPVTTDTTMSEPMTTMDMTTTSEPLLAEPVTTTTADWQDLAVLVTLALDTTDLEINNFTPSTVEGKLNINPNNSPKNKFTVEKTGGGTITRDDLHDGAPIDARGLLYDGGADSILIKPKGNGSQNTLLINGVVHEVNNNTTYFFDYPGMNVVIYNDRSDGGKAMGHWWIDITTATPNVTEGDVTDDKAASSQLIWVDHKTGEYLPMMELGRPYDSLASVDGQTFYATSGKQVYKIDSAAGVETLLADHISGDFKGLGFSGTTLYVFETMTDRVFKLDPTTGFLTNLGTSMNTIDLSTIVFTPLVEEISTMANFD